MKILQLYAVAVGTIAAVTLNTASLTAAALRGTVCGWSCCGCCVCVCVCVRVSVRVCVCVCVCVYVTAREKEREREGEKRESSRRIFYIISPRVIIKAIIIIERVSESVSVFVCMCVCVSVFDLLQLIENADVNTLPHHQYPPPPSNTNSHAFHFLISKYTKRRPERIPSG